MTAYCVKCKEKKEISNPQEITMKRKGGKTGKAITGVCPTCGTKMFRILPLNKQEKSDSPQNNGNQLDDNLSI